MATKSFIDADSLAREYHGLKGGQGVGVKIERKGLRELENKLNRLIECAQPEMVEPLLEEVGKPMAEEMRQRAPVKEGHLRRAISARLFTRKKGMPAGIVVGVKLSDLPGHKFKGYPAIQERRYSYIRKTWDGRKNGTKRKVITGLVDRLERGARG